MRGKRYTEEFKIERSSSLQGADIQRPRSLNGLLSVSTACMRGQSGRACPKPSAKLRTPSLTRCGD